MSGRLMFILCCFGTALLILYAIVFAEMCDLRDQYHAMCALTGEQSDKIEQLWRIQQPHDLHIFRQLAETPEQFRESVYNKYPADRRPPNDYWDCYYVQFDAPWIAK